MAEGTSSSASGGIGFVGLLTVALIVLKLLGYINISWFVIAGVFFAPLAIIVGILLIILLVGLIIDLRR